MRLTGKNHECDWDGVDSYMIASPPGGGGGHSTTECIEACRNRGLQCNYAARSSDGYCHLFLTCKGQGSRGWKVYEKYCKQNPGKANLSQTHSISFFFGSVPKSPIQERNPCNEHCLSDLKSILIKILSFYTYSYPICQNKIPPPEPLF